MFWGCFNFRASGALVKFNCIMDSTKYQAQGCRWTFQQDNDPKHTSEFTQKRFLDNKMYVIYAVGWMVVDAPSTKPGVAIIMKL